jgi:hypothetical protein
MTKQCPPDALAGIVLNRQLNLRSYIRMKNNPQIAQITQM